MEIGKDKSQINTLYDKGPIRVTTLCQPVFVYFRSYGISLRARYSQISDEGLDEEVRTVVAENRYLGQRVVQGSLAANGLTVQRQRVAESLIHVDEVAVALRWSRSVQRRKYRVVGPNALWHIDGNHKLIR